MHTPLGLAPFLLGIQVGLAGRSPVSRQIGRWWGPHAITEEIHHIVGGKSNGWGRMGWRGPSSSTWRVRGEAHQSHGAVARG
jgi:hypothetical protein